MQLKPYKVNIKTGGVNVAVIHENTAHRMDLHVNDRVLLTSDRSKAICVLDITKNGFPKHKIGLFSEAYDELNIDPGDTVELTVADKPKSVLHIREKLDGKRLSPAQLNDIVYDVVNGNLSDVEMTYFVSGCYAYGLNDDETAALTKAIVHNGKKLEFKGKIVADKHCIGGVPGNRVTPIVVSIVTAAGILMPKTSSRAITSPAGTADAVEVVCNVTINAHKLMTIAKKVGGFMVWGGGVDLAAADDRMIKIRNPMSLDPEGMLLASIMAKKHSVSANHVIIDIPVGPGVKIPDAARAQHLKRRFLKIGKMLGMKVQVMITDGSQPIGNGIGPLLEMIDVMNILKNEKEAPADLREKSIMEAGLLLELCGKAKKGQGSKLATHLLDSGKAWRKFNQIINAQGKKKIPKLAKYSQKIAAPVAGKVKAITNKPIAHLARLAGAPKDVTGGLYLHKKVGDTVKKGEALYTVYSGNPERLKYTVDFIKSNGTGYQIK
ncbi:MAG: thymidine phosphorylase family protein [Patescibacteria group bacterium]